jgi:NADH:ubiquinone oxidoreductase subunit 3 (subunit A)
MQNISPWIVFLSFLGLCFFLMFAALFLSRLLQVKAKTYSPNRDVPYECGEEQDGIAWVRFHPRYYLVALIFVLFDIEALFMIPWALNLKELGVLGIWEMLFFVTMLLLAWLYALCKGIFNWQK